ncbi:hypothetical protein D3C73_1577830 [compost metagenome]
MVFEDAEAGIEAAKHAGMLAVGIGSKDVLKEADVVTESFEELLHPGKAKELAFIFGPVAQTFAQ